MQRVDPQFRWRIAEAIGLLDEAERGGMPADAVAATWRFAGIVDVDEVLSWLDVGVFDGHRAGVLKMAGVLPLDLLAHPRAREIGVEFALGHLSVNDVRGFLAELCTSERSERRGRTLLPPPPRVAS